MRAQTCRGLSVTEFCALKNLGIQQYYYWRRMLKETGASELVNNQLNVTVSEQQTPCLFTEVKIADDAKRSTVTVSGMVRIEIRGVTITADEAYPVHQIVELLKGAVATC